MSLCVCVEYPGCRSRFAFGLQFAFGPPFAFGCSAGLFGVLAAYTLSITGRQVCAVSAHARR